MKYVASKRERDSRVVTSLVRRMGPLSRSKIHELSHLRNSEICDIVRSLQNDGWLIPVGRGNNPMGRKRVLLSLNPERGFVVGAGFDDESVLAGVMNLKAELKSEIRVPACVEGGSEGLTNQLIACVHEVIAQAGVSMESVLGVGVAGSGVVDKREGVFLMSSTLEFFREVPLRRIFEDEFRTPVIVENLTRAKAVAERVLGSGHMAEDMIYIEYGK